MEHNMGQSVLQDWVIELPLRAQGTLLTVVRGCDLVSKLPLDSTARRLVGAMRHSFMVPHDVREVDIKGAFFQSVIPFVSWSEFGHYPWHWLSHIVHAIEVLAYNHPVLSVRAEWEWLYRNACKSFHMNPETRDQWIARVNEDRIATGEVVS